MGEGPLGESVYSKDGGDEGTRHATDAKCAADGHGRLPDAGGHGSPTPDCSEVLRPSTSPRPTAEEAAAEYDETLCSKPGRGHDRSANEHRSGYGQHDARHGCSLPTQARALPGIMKASTQQGSVVVPGQEPLTTAMLAAAPMQEQKQMLGERIFPLIQRQHSDLAGKITGMLLEIDNAELLHMLEDPASLQAKVDEAVTVLQAHQMKTEASKK